MCVTVKLQAAQQGLDTASAQLRAAGKRGRVSVANVKDGTLRAVAETVQRIERGGADPQDAFEAKLATKLPVGPWKRGVRVASLDAALILAADEMKRADGRKGAPKDGSLDLKEQATLSPTTAQLLLFAMDLVHAKNGVHDPKITLKMRMDNMLHGTPIPGRPAHGAPAAAHGAAAPAAVTAPAAHAAPAAEHVHVKADDKLPEIHVHIDGDALAHDVHVHVHLDCSGGHDHGAPAAEPPKLTLVAPPAH